ncbi:MAG: Small-conductance mechanosensitive channel MscMJ [Methanoregulaceae archaeon PtaU1.Bin222]|nr:MAG: Small-conductance mechanosensitive channel MscMJ [Methanoregulaceae archaeon PtaU1.Bin222]
MVWVTDVAFEYLNSAIIGTVTMLDLVIFGISVLVTVAIAKVIGFYLKRSFSDRVEQGELEFLIKVIQGLIIVIGIYLALPSFDINLADMLVVGGTIGLVVAFASQKIVSNFGSGLFLIIERPIKPGDSINIGSVSGTVEEIRILSTIIKTYEGIYVRIPNEKVFTSDITNYVANVARRFEYSIGISYQSDAEKAIRLVRGLLEKEPFVLRHPAPSVFVDTLGDSSVNLRVFIWAPSRVWWSVRTEMLWTIKKALEDAGIEIPFPQRVVTFSQPTGGAVPGSRGQEHD